MDAVEIKAFLHELRNSLNAAKMNAALLVPGWAAAMPAEAVDQDALRGLHAALHEAERRVLHFHSRLEAESGGLESAP